jgi:putative aminopeptidase FrvX
MRRLILTLALLTPIAFAQTVPGSLAQDLRDYVATPAIPGYEGALARHIAQELAAFNPTRDNLNNVIVRIGSGAPRRLVVTGLDEPGYIVTAITPDGYLRLQRLPTHARLPLFNELANAQPLHVFTRSGAALNGVMAGLSIHLQPGRLQSPNPDDLDNLYVDLGASSAAQVRRAGVHLLSPVALDRQLYVLARGQLAALSIGNRFGPAALVHLLRHLDQARLTGTLEVAFLTQEWTGNRGLARVLHRPAGSAPWDQILYVGPAGQPLNRALRPRITDHLTLPVAWFGTPAAFIGAHAYTAFIQRLETALNQSPAAPRLPQPETLAPPPTPARPAVEPTPTQILQALTPLYGVDPHEAPVRRAVRALLPPWAHPITDESGNLILHWGDSGPHAAKLLFIAHTDEIGFAVQSIAPDGRLLLRPRGGFDLDYYLGHPILVHTASGMRPGVIDLPAGWRAPGFNLRRQRPPFRADVGARSAAEAAALGIAVGDSVTIPKKYRALLGRRSTARAFDDRVGDAALIAAAWRLGPHVPGRDITLVWSVGEEIGLVGAQALARRLAAAGRSPNYVFAIDTFVSSDSPLESHRFADTPLGRGFVIRAADDSSLTPLRLARRLQSLARAAAIPVQIGETGGGNDGSAFVPFGAVDLPLGWPLRYSHSPAEVISTRDLDSLTRILVTLAHQW